MKRTGIARRVAIVVACAGGFLAAPAGAMAGLTTHSATTNTLNSAGEFVATAKCGPGEHVISGGFSSPGQSAPVVSRALHGNSWTVHLAPVTSNELTTYAYCAGGAGVSRHENKVTATAVPANTTATSHCASGETLVSGGFAFLSQPSGQTDATTYSDYATRAGEWKVTSAFTNTPAKLAAFAYCQPGVSVKVRSSSSPISSGRKTGSATASCHKGETLLAGGYHTTPRPDYENQVGPDLFYNASHRSGARSWTASAINYSGVAGTITVFAYCKA